MKVEKHIIFISHVHEDASLAKTIQQWLTKRLAGSLEIFVSSDKEKSLQGGNDWWDTIKEKLRASQLVLVLVTKRSKDRKWIYFESGGSYFLEKTTIPLLIGNLKISELTEPLSKLIAYN